MQYKSSIRNDAIPIIRNMNIHYDKHDKILLNNVSTQEGSLRNIQTF